MNTGLAFKNMMYFITFIYLTHTIINIATNGNINIDDLVLIGIAVVAGRFIRNNILMIAVAATLVLIMRISLVVKEGAGPKNKTPAQIKCMQDVIDEGITRPVECLKCCYKTGGSTNDPGPNTGAAAGMPGSSSSSDEFNCDICPDNCYDKGGAANMGNNTGNTGKGKCSSGK